ncbi:hypothetical protein DSUL_100093 [Desulfovibrionales bacterium]
MPQLLTIYPKNSLSKRFIRLTIYKDIPGDDNVVISWPIYAVANLIKKYMNQ